MDAVESTTIDHHDHNHNDYRNAAPPSHFRQASTQHSLPLPLDPDLQDAFPAYLAACPAQTSTEKNRPSVDDEVEGQGTDESQGVAQQHDQSITNATSAGNRSQYLPPTFSSDEDDDGQREPRRRSLSCEAVSPEKSRPRLVIRLKKPAQIFADEMVSTRGARPAVGYTEPVAEDEEQPMEDVEDDEPVRANGSGSGAFRASRRNTRSSQDNGGGHESDDPLGDDIPSNDARAHLDAHNPDDIDEEEEEEDEILPPKRTKRGSAANSRPASASITTRSGRSTRSANYAEADDEEYEQDVEHDFEDDREHVSSSRKRSSNKSLGGFVVDDGEDQDDDGDYGKQKRGLKGQSSKVTRLQELADRRRVAAPNKSSRGSRRRVEMLQHLDSDDDDDDLEMDDDSQPGYRLRERTKKVDYSLAGPPAEPLRDGMGRIVKRKQSSRTGVNSDVNSGAYELDATRAAHLGLPYVASLGAGRKGKTGWDALPLSMTGKDYAKAFGDEQDSSDDDDIPASRKVPPPSIFGGSGSAGLLGAGPAALGGGGGAGAAGAGNDGSARDAFGRIKKGGDVLADVDPLGVNMQVDFSSVGGLDGHIQQLKEMVSLPLLYPEVFTHFKVTPPRGVLFHGPPGTGKTLVARALAASCSTTGQQISFFMRKGADCLSKWVGEAERQLRMLFDEARASQPSIIFFDEIDGLAPVRSSKQDQIHASIVSTLLALMDGMDGRGQVVVIGATNRPDSVDPALRRPGRFDREFYFPLPSREARLSIIDIHTRGWEPPLTSDFKNKLAEITKGYGGADLRALCTEAALNAIQRRYPQIYQTTERLLLEPASIKVEAKDFMMSVNKLVPSSARSASSSAAALPSHLKPILADTVHKAIAALEKVLPPASKRNPLEEAMWEDEPTAGSSSDLDGTEKDGFGREMMLQTFESLRIFRPRLVVYGTEGMGQSFVGSALLHHLEGYHVQSLDVGALLGDSTRTPEAAVVQLFVEAKRHKPSVIYIPGLVHWANSVSETVRATTKALLDELAASDPILLLAIAEGPMDEIPPEVARWFGYLDDTKVEASRPTASHRTLFFEDLITHVSKPPTEFPDAVPRRRRVLEELPKAPPKAPRQATAAELQQQVYDDQRTLEHLKYRLGPVLAELRKRFKKFNRDVWDEYNLRNLTEAYQWHKESGKVIVRLRYDKGFRRRRNSSVDEAFLISGADGLLSSSQTQSQGQNLNIAHGECVATGQRAVNGDHADAVGHVDTDTQMKQPHTGHLDGSEPISSASQQALPPVIVTLEGEDSLTKELAPNGDVSPQAALPPPSNTGSDGEYDYRDMPIWTMTLERMQRRLYHNAYLTIASFLDDLDKIVANAEQAQEVDMERMVRAHQMRNFAVVLLDQHFDINFRLECEDMAGRQLAREQEKARAEQDAKKVIEAARAAGKGPAANERPRRPSGERFSARVQGHQPEHRYPLDVGAIERGSGKRSRTSSARNSGIDSSDHKRARNDLIGEVDAMIEAQVSIEEGTEGSIVKTSRDSAADPRIGQVSHPVIEAAGPSSAEVGMVSGLGSILAEVDHGGVRDSPEVIERRTSQADVHRAVMPLPTSASPARPTFVCPPSALESLRRHLVQCSRLFSVDQLLQLRAASFDAVWRKRADWDRSALIGELESLANKIEGAVNSEMAAKE